VLDVGTDAAHDTKARTPAVSDVPVLARPLDFVPMNASKTSSTPSTKSTKGPMNHVSAMCCIAFAALVSACSAETSAPKAADGAAPAMSAEQISKLKADPAVKALLDKTLKNMRFVEGGTFEMGDFGPKHSPDKLYYMSAEDNKPSWKVTLDSFSMSAFKTSYEDYDVFSRAMGRELIAQDNKARFPKVAAGLSWPEAREYCQWLGTLLELPIDLPTEAQWEYAARNRGQLVVFPTDNGKYEEKRNVWQFDQRTQAKEKLRQEARRDIGAPWMLPLGQFPPTPLGFYDLITDGFEWMLDWYDPKLPERGEQVNPKGPETGTEKVVRSSGATESLEFGPGMTFSRQKRNPDPPRTRKTISGDVVATNPNTATTARCVVNQKRRLDAP
jgi:formylglycine-generating enzyme required for sulfatase activity